MKGLILTYALTYGGCAVALFQPWIGVLIYIAFCILKPDSIWFYSVPAGNYSRIVAIGLLIGWGLRGLGSWRFGRATPIVWSFIAFVGWAAISAARAPFQDTAWAYVEMIVKILLPFLAGITMIDSLERLKQLAWTIVISQGYVAYEMNMFYLGGFNMAEEGFGDMGRAVIGTGMVICLAMAIILALAAERRWQRCLAGGCALFIGHTVVLTYSRGAMLATGLMGGCIIWLLPKTPKHVAFLAAAGALGAVMAGPSVHERFATTFAAEGTRDASAQSRLVLWNNCLDIISKEPLFGVGPEHFQYHAPQYGWGEGKEAHMLWLQTGAELGTPGMLLLIGFYTLTCIRLLPLATSFGRWHDPWLPAFAAMTVAGLLGFMLAAVFVTVARLELSYYAVLLGAGTLKVAGSVQPAAISSIESEQECLVPCLS